MRFPPSSETQKWSEQNRGRRSSQGDILLVTEILLISIATCVVVGRGYARFSSRTLGLDDLFIAIAYILAVGLTVAVILAVKDYGWDLHIWNLPINDAVSSRAISWTSQVLYLCSSSMTKLSLLFFYRRIFDPMPFRRVVNAMIVLTVCYLFTFLMVLLFDCRPLSYYWHILVEGAKGECTREDEHLLASCIINVLLDFGILLLPLRLFPILRISPCQKVQLALMFGAGIFVCATATTKVYFVYFVTRKTYDVSWYGYYLWILTAAEVDVGIICACFPACRSLFGRSKGQSNSHRTEVMA